MSIPVWPATLPAGTIEDGFVEDIASDVIRSEVSSGPAKTRRRSTKVLDRFSISMVITRTQRDTLVAFFRTTLAGGALPFSWVHPVTGASMDMRFVDGIKIVPRGPLGVATFTVEAV